MKEFRRLSTPAHGRRWLPIRASRDAGQRKKTFASAQNQGPALAESVLTTFSFRHLNARPGPRACRKAQDADKTSRVLLVVAVTHGERGQVGAIQRVVGMPAHHCHVALI